MFSFIRYHWTVFQSGFMDFLPATPPPNCIWKLNWLQSLLHPLFNLPFHFTPFGRCSVISLVVFICFLQVCTVRHTYRQVFTLIQPSFPKKWLSTEGAVSILDQGSSTEELMIWGRWSFIVRGNLVHCGMFLTNPVSQDITKCLQFCWAHSWSRISLCKVLEVTPITRNIYIEPS